MVKNLLASAGDVRDTDSFPGSRISPGGGRGNPLQYSCLSNPMDRGDSQATVYEVANSWTQLSDYAQHRKVINEHTYTNQKIFNVDEKRLILQQDAT